MTFSQAQQFTMPFGKHRNLALDTIAETDEGLRYLDWMRGNVNVYGQLKEALDVYLTDPDIRAELVKVIDDRTEEAS